MDGRVLIQNFLDLSGIHILAAADEHILLAVNDIEITFVIVIGDIASMKVSALINSLCGCLWIIEIARTIRRPFEDQLPRFIRTEESVPVTDDLRVHEEVRSANRTRFADGIFRGERKNAGTELGHAEALLEADIFLSRIFLNQRHRQRRATRCAETQRR